MCGRFSQATPWSEVWAFSQPLVLSVPAEPIVPRYNIAPTQLAWVIASDGQGGAKAGAMRWGLVPHWAKDSKSGFATFNARIETAATKPTFRQAFERRHCLVPVSGYYEWVGEGREKQPWYIHPAEGSVMFLAGLWERWVSPAGESVLSFTVLTEPAEGEMAALHLRKPVMIQAALAPEWLNADAHAAADVLARVRPAALQWHTVGSKVGNARADGEELIRALG